MRIRPGDLRSWLLAGLFLSILFPLEGLAEDKSATPPIIIRGKTDTGTKSHPDLLTVFNRPIIVLREDLYGDSPSDRVQAIKQRLSDLVAQGKTKSLTTRPTAEGTMIELDGELVMLITTGDVDPLSGATLEGTVQTTLHRLQLALSSMQEQRNVGHLLRASAMTLVATLLYGALIWFAGIAKVRLWILIGRGQKAISKTLGYSGTTVLPQLQVVYQWIVRIVFWILVLVATNSWLTFCLRQFPYTAPWGEVLGQYLFATLRRLGQGAVVAFPGVFVAVIILVVTRLLTKLVRLFFGNVRDGRIAITWLDPDNARPTGRIVTFIMWAFALVMIYPYLPGSGSAAFQGVGVFVGLLVSLGGSGLISQVMGGFVLMYTRSLKVGEYVRVGEQEGTVESIGFMSTRLRTIKNEMINIPNAVLMGVVTTNYSRLARTKGVMVSTTVTIGYDSPWRQVHAMLLRAAEKTAGLLRTPPPFVWQRALSDFYVEYELNVCLEEPERRIAVMSILCAHIQDEFNEHGVQILSPHFMMNPPDKVWVPKKKWHDPPAGSSQKRDEQDGPTSGTGRSVGPND